MRVLHAVETFLRVSENWIFPQIELVQDVEASVLCSKVSNTKLFPFDSRRIFLDPPPWTAWGGLSRAANSLAFRLGSPSLIASHQVARWKPALIHAHFGARGCDLLPMKRMLGVPLVTSFYGIDAWKQAEAPSTRSRLAALFSEGDLFLAEGPAMAARLVEIGAPAAKTRVVHLGVDVANIAFQERDFTPPFRVLMMARFVEKKGLIDGLLACSAARTHGAPIEITIIGDAVDESGRAIKRELLKIAETRPLRGAVRFAGFLEPSAARAEMRTAHLFLCPSKHARDGDAEGGSPLSLTEAMAGGLLCIGTRHCDIPQIIRDRETGFLRESGDIEGLSAALMEASESFELVRALCRAGRTHVETNFSVDQMLNKLSALYRELTE